MISVNHTVVPTFCSLWRCWRGSAIFVAWAFETVWLRFNFIPSCVTGWIPTRDHAQQETHFRKWKKCLTHLVGTAQSSLSQSHFESYVKILPSVASTLIHFMACYLWQAKCRLVTSPFLNTYQGGDCMHSLADPDSLHASLFLYWSGYLTLELSQRYFEFVTVFPYASVSFRQL